MRFDDLYDSQTALIQRIRIGLHSIPLFVASLADRKSAPIKQMRKKNVANIRKNLRRVDDRSHEQESQSVKSSKSSSVHHSLPDFYRFNQRLRNRSYDVLESLTSFLQSLLFVPEKKSAEIRIHVKQDAHRRIPPGRNPGSGGTR